MKGVVKMKKILGTINVHSLIDVITNSSSEIFINDVNKTEEQINVIIDEVMSEFGCSAVSLTIERKYDYETDTEIDGVYDIWYDYEVNHPPCKLMETRLKEALGIND
jgi:hypothetical protein